MENLALKTDNLIEEQNLTPSTNEVVDISKLDYSKKYSNEFYDEYIENFDISPIVILPPTIALPT